ncbi:hypothetical protein T265_04108 [Opisthorchis viverrini]|uniref:Uncharacterized protein n=1 Tax=Opisthorchis viverrini TaxID=6198 RepID=A0A074ZPC0_OPIVI|nr:hypothetical protein T265_04108 [Opisthorchis viverrini]KER29268.1 hypothetical protein T265_04108 [Opisthorchis viverrini]
MPHMDKGLTVRTRNLKCLALINEKLFPRSNPLTYRSRCQILGLEPLFLRRFKMNLTVLHHLLHKNVFIAEARPNVNPRPHYRLSKSCNLLVYPPARTNLRHHFFLVNYARIWNRLPEQLQNITHHHTFLSPQTNSLAVSLLPPYSHCTCVLRDLLHQRLYAICLFELTEPSSLALLSSDWQMTAGSWGICQCTKFIKMVAGVFIIALTALMPA